LIRPINISFQLKEETLRVKKKSLRSIKLINEKLVPSKPAIDQINLALDHFRRSDFEYFDSKRKARALCCLLLYPKLYALIQSKKEFNKFISILTQYPSKSVAYHLLLAVMMFWKQEFTQKRLVKFCKSYLVSNSYNQESNQFKISKYVFDKNGIELLVDRYTNKDEDLLTYLNEIGLRQTAIKSQFFEVVVKQIATVLITNLTRDNNDLTRIQNICNLSNDGYISKPIEILIISRIISRIDKQKMYNQDIRKYALDKIGDVDHQNWRLSSGLSNNEVATIQSAKQILEGWMTDLFLDRFWRLIEDEYRRRFWKRYSKLMSNVKIILDKGLYAELDDNIKVNPYLNRIYSGKKGAVLVFEINSRLFVEFGGYAAGPLQVYKNRDDIQEIIDSLSNSCYSKSFPVTYYTPHLKGFSAESDNLMYGHTILRDYGRFPHHGQWHSKLKLWMNTYGKN
jgi:hypothetical protein